MSEKPADRIDRICAAICKRWEAKIDWSFGKGPSQMECRELVGMFNKAMRRKRRRKS